jgi:hypothetical protein
MDEYRQLGNGKSVLIDICRDACCRALELAGLMSHVGAGFSPCPEDDNHGTAGFMSAGDMF